MATPKIENIALKIVALVNAITTGAGFNQTLVAVRPKRLHLEGDINTDNTVIIEQEDAEVIEQSLDSTIWKQGFTLQVIVIDSDDATDSIDTRLNKVACDIIKKIYTGSNWQLDGLADAIYLRSIEKFIADPQVAGVAVNIDVHYEVSTSDPYT